MEKVIAYLRENEKRHMEELFELLRIPSVSSQTEHDGDTLHCAEWTAEHLAKLGFTAGVEKTEGHPVVYAEWLKKPGKPTVLIYGHYDVQPEDPVELWDSPPFEPVIKGTKLFCRGAVDDKGQYFAHIKALEALMNVNGELPVNVKVLIEGEEEVGSVALEKYLPMNHDKLKNDLIIVSDSPMYRKGIPTITLGLRGITYFQIDLTSCATDLHSGSFGGAVPNAATAACMIVSKLKDEKGRILVPGVYDDVRPLTQVEKESFAKLPFTDKEFMDSIGLTAVVGEEGYTTLERLWSRPTCDVMGIKSGYIGEGAKTVIPAKSMIKVSLRLVPDQKPEKIEKAFMDYIQTITPPGVKAEVTCLHGGDPYVADPNHPAFKAAAEALKDGFGADTAYTREGGSIPIVNALTKMWNTPCLLIGLGLPDENAHAPNEYMDVDNFYGGARALAYLFHKLGK